MQSTDIFHSMTRPISPHSHSWFVYPRSLEELFAERSYLLSSLNKENFKATDLLRKLTHLEETLMRNQVFHVCRKARKQIGWLRYRINESTRQEKTILNGLSQLAHEIKSRERWNQIEGERRQYGQISHIQLGLYQDIHQVPFTPVTPEFQYIGFPLPCLEMPLPQNYPDSPRQHSGNNQSSTLSYLRHDQDVNAGPTENFIRLDIPIKRFQTMSLCRPAPMQRSSSMSRLDVTLMAANFPHTAVSQTKRHSTGSRLSKTRSDCSDREGEASYTDESSEQPRYSGFYVK